jgi:hypothetical protein
MFFLLLLPVTIWTLIVPPFMIALWNIENGFSFFLWIREFTSHILFGCKEEGLDLSEYEPDTLCSIHNSIFDVYVKSREIPEHHYQVTKQLLVSVKSQMQPCSCFCFLSGMHLFLHQNKFWIFVSLVGYQFGLVTDSLFHLFWSGQYQCSGISLDFTYTSKIKQRRPVTSLTVVW